MGMSQRVTVLTRSGGTAKTRASAIRIRISQSMLDPKMVEEDENADNEP